jgi:hypothetical protein
MWQNSEYSSQLYIKVFLAHVYRYAQRRLNARCAWCPVHLRESRDILWDCVSCKCTCHNLHLCRMEARPKHVHVGLAGWSKTREPSFELVQRQFKTKYNRKGAMIWSQFHVVERAIAKKYELHSWPCHVIAGALDCHVTNDISITSCCFYIVSPLH